MFSPENQGRGVIKVFGVVEGGKGKKNEIEGRSYFGLVIEIAEQWA